MSNSKAIQIVSHNVWLHIYPDNKGYFLSVSRHRDALPSNHRAPRQVGLTTENGGKQWLDEFAQKVCSEWDKYPFDKAIVVFREDTSDE